MIEETYKKISIPLLLALVGFVFFYDLGNLEAIRQGTEGFYLQISKEMFDSKDFLTPTYLNERHWSKPPMHFWFAQPLYMIFGNSIFAARLSMVLITLFGISSISKWVKKYFEMPYWQTFIYLASSFCFLKYSRIYMMEVPLTILSALASLKFFEFITSDISSGKKYFIQSIIFLAMATLVKGPVALVMVVGSCGLFCLFQKYYHGESILKDFFLWMAFSFLLSSIWFVISYYQYGSEFFEYFFLRENLGKFTSANYPIRSVFQGLLIYGLPWSLFFPLALYRYSKKAKHDILSKDFSPRLFLIFNFLVFFCLWLIPSQRSHHYAVPSLPFILILIYTSCFKNFDDKISRFKNYFNTIRVFFILINILLIAAVSLYTFLPIKFPSIINFKLAICIIVLFFSIFILSRKQTPNTFSVATLLSIASIFYILLPTAYKPLIPKSTVEIVKSEDEIGVHYRKPYFIQQYLQKNIAALPNAAISTYLQKHSGRFIILTEDAYNDSRFRDLIKENSSLVRRWPVWRRGINFKDIWKSIETKNIEPLYQYLILIKSIK